MNLIIESQITNEIDIINRREHPVFFYSGINVDLYHRIKKVQRCNR